MSEKSTIEWTQSSWNPFRGCRRCSPGCGTSCAGGCYAERFARRFGNPGGPFFGFVKSTPNGPRWTGKVALIPEHLEDPIHWRRGRKIFVCSMSDLFYEEATPDMIQAVFDSIFRAKQHTYQILTKRAERMSQILPHVRYATGHKWADSPEKNVWLGVSVENQEYAAKRIPFLLQTPAAVRFLSVEPMLGPVDLSEWLSPVELKRGLRPGIDWVIVGAESGPGARPLEEDWVRAIRDQCVKAGVAFFLKQLKRGKKVVKTPELDGRRWAEFPDDKKTAGSPGM